MCMDDFFIEKPEHWAKLPLFLKIVHYSRQLTASYEPYIDKIKAKEVVAQVCGDMIKIAKIVRILEGPEDFTEADISEHHMLKATHGSGWNINMNKTTQVEEVLTALKSWNCIYRNGKESQYKYLTPRFFIEEKIDGTQGTPPVYMFRCIHGSPLTIGVKHNDVQNSYTMDWQIIGENNLPDLEKPAVLCRMIDAAKRLSEPFEFVRIDFYLIENTIYFSEYTFTPAGGAQIFSSDLEFKLGQLWV